MNTKHIKQFVKASLLSSALLGAYSLQAQTLIEAVDQAVKTNPEVSSNAYKRLATDHTIDQAKAGYFPTVDVNLGYGVEWSENSSTTPGGKKLRRNEAGIKINQMLYDGFETKNAIDQATSLADASAYQVANSSERIGLQAVKTYLDVLRFEALVGLANNNLVAHQDVHRRIKSRKQGGVGTQVDLDQANARVALANSNAEATNGNYSDMQTAYLSVVGILPVDLSKPDFNCCDHIPKTLKEALEIAFTSHPELRALAANYDAALSQQLAAKAAMRPKVNLELEANKNYDVDGVKGKNQDVLAMLRLYYNLYNGGADSARIAEMGQISEQQLARALASKRNVEESVRLSWSALEAAAAELPYLKKHAESSERAYKAYAKQYYNGQRTLLDLLDAENERFTSHSDYVHGQYDELYARYRLLTSMGKLVSSLGITPREEAITAADKEKGTERKEAAK